jgi:hypothetical protein
MPASNQQSGDAIGGTLQFLRQRPKMQAESKSVCHMLVVRTSHAGKRTFSTRGLPRPAHSGEINDEIAQRSDATRHAQFFGTDFVMKRSGSTAKIVLRDGRARRICRAHGKGAHTDPQFLFWAAS